jgi:hypothetical protein
VLVFSTVPFTTAGRANRLNWVIVLLITCTVTASCTQQTRISTANNDIAAADSYLVLLCTDHLHQGVNALVPVLDLGRVDQRAQIGYRRGYDLVLEVDRYSGAHCHHYLSIICKPHHSRVSYHFNCHKASK